LDNRIQPLIRMARHRAATPDSKKDEWDADAEMILTRGGYQALEWIDASGRVVWTTPPGAGDAAPDGNAAFEPRRRAAMDAARQNRQLAATRPVDLVTGGKGTIVVVPVFVRDELAGYVAGVFRYQLLFQNLLSSNPAPSYAMAVTDGGEPVFAQGSPGHSANLARTAALAAGALAWQLRIAPTESLVVQAHSPVGGALLVGGGFLAVLFTMLTYLVQRPRSRVTIEQAVAGQGGDAGSLADVSQLPVITYGRDGTAMAWNDAARLLFAGAPPNIPSWETRFRTIHATFLRASASPENVEALRVLLDSCAQPAVIFDAEGKFVAANPASARMLGWSDATWSGRGIGTSPSAAREALAIQSVLLLQGQWATPAAGSALAATAG
jgi:PAS domain-containing protein